jgi:hypothetical protein
MQRDSSVAQGQCIDARDSNVDGVRLHVQAASGYTGRASAEELVAPGAAIATDDVDFRAGTAERSGKIGEDVENVGIVMSDGASAVVPQEMVESLFSLRQKSVATAIDDINPLARVRMTEAKTVFLGGRMSRRGVVVAL